MRAAKQPIEKVVETAVIAQTIAFRRGITSFYIGRLGEEFDRFINVTFFRGQIGETISLHAANEALNGDAWACALCMWLHWTVERDHCHKTIAVGHTPITAALLAGLQLLIIALAMLAMIGGIVCWIGGLL